MMDCKRIFELFREQYMKAGESFSFSLFPILFSELKKYGVDRSAVTDQFAKDFHSILLPNAKTSVLLHSIEYISHYSALTLTAKAVKTAPVAPVEVEKQPTPVVSTVKAVKSTVDIDYDSPIPREEDEGDPLYTPPEDRLDLKPEDCADAVTDWEFIAQIKAIGNKYE
jgi:hypothetical protein